MSISDSDKQHRCISPTTFFLGLAWLGVGVMIAAFMYLVFVRHV